MNLESTPLSGLYIAQSDVSADHRGSFSRFYCEDELKEAVAGRAIRQINFSRTENVGAIRGLHFQHPPHAEMKMIRCLRGRVFDVAVDLRRISPTFLQWYAVELSAEDRRMMVIPEGFAHGFQVLEAGSELLYLHTASYAPSAEGGVGHDDPALAIAWPLPAADISARDAAHPRITEDFTGIEL